MLWIFPTSMTDGWKYSWKGALSLNSTLNPNLRWCGTYCVVVEYRVNVCGRPFLQHESAAVCKLVLRVSLSWNAGYLTYLRSPISSQVYDPLVYHKPAWNGSNEVQRERRITGSQLFRNLLPQETEACNRRESSLRFHSCSFDDYQFDERIIIFRIRIGIFLFYYLFYYSN